MMNQRGFTFVELIVTMAILMSLTAMGYSLVGATTRQQAKAAQVEFAAELRAARHLAMSTHKKVKVQLDVTRARTVLSEAPEIPVREYDYGARGLTLESASNGRSISFSPNGRSATATTLTFATSRGVRLQLTISFTGRVSIRS